MFRLTIESSSGCWNSKLLTIECYIANVKQSHYRPWQALRFPGGWGSQILRQSAHEGGKVVSSTHRPPLLQVIFLVLIYVGGWVDPRAIVRPEGLCQWKSPVTPSGIEPATFRFVPQCLNHCDIAYPLPPLQMLHSIVSSFEFQQPEDDSIASRNMSLNSNI
jgi:hypothetical protein